MFFLDFVKSITPFHKDYKSEFYIFSEYIVFISAQSHRKTALCCKKYSLQTKSCCYYFMKIYPVIRRTDALR